MKPSLRALSRFWFVHLLILLLALGGCTSPLFQLRGQSPEPEQEEELPEQGPKLIGDLTIPWNLTSLKVESVALVTGLEGTGSDPPPSPQRSMLVSEMQTHDVVSPSQILRSPSTSMVLLRGYLPPGIQKDEHFDVEVHLPPGSKTTSLRGGWLMPSRMKELARVENRLRTGHILALASGPVHIDALLEKETNEVLEKRGRVLGGGVALESRPLGLIVRSRASSVKTSAMIGAAINTRFYTFERNLQKEVATPKTDNFIELEVHPRYRNNLGRYIRVVRSIAVGERPQDRPQRLELLGRMLLDPTTAPSAALQLEAIGHDATPVLKKGLASPDVEVRFYAAEALAYLDQPEAAKPLGEIARDESAFRWHALTALSVMDHVVAYDELHKLLSSKSAETRYGAFRAMRARNHQDPVVRGELMEDFAYHTISTTGEPMVHIAWSKRPEIVLFGHDQRLQGPTALFAGKQLLIRALPGGRIKVSRFAVGQGDEHELCSGQLDEVVRAVVKLGGTYNEVVQMLLDSQQQQLLEGRLVVDALPQRGRTFRRQEQLEGDPVEQETWTEVASPLPDLFSGDEAVKSEEPAEGHVGDVDPLPEAAEERPKGSFFDTMTSWFTY